MTKHVPASSQLTLSLFDTTSLGWGFGLDAPAPSVPPQFRDDAADVPAPLSPSAPRQPAHTFRLMADRALAPTWKVRAADNIAAIHLLQQIEDQARHATPEEQAKLALFTGFGASDLANSLFRRGDEAFRPGWEDLGRDLEQLVSAQDLASLARATQYAHYTPEFIVRAIWQSLAGMGFAGGRVLEPGCGTGLFLAAMPEAMAPDTSVTAIEMDPTTARIAKLLYPEAWVRQEDFCKAKLAEQFDLAIGNPPFSDRTVRAADPAGKLGLSLHEYFVARSIERLRPGGLAAFVCSRFLMDRVDPRARVHIAGMADLVGAVRLPQGAMLAEAGTEIVVDILFFRKRLPGEQASSPEWMDLAEVEAEEPGEGPLWVNRYFADHPAMVLGRHAWTSSAFGPAYTCRASSGTALGPLLSETLTRALPQDIYVPSSAPPPASLPKAPSLHVGTAAEGAMVKEGSYVVLDDALMQVIDGAPVPVEIRSGRNSGIPAKHARIIRGLVPVRDALREVIRAQADNRPWGAWQVKLRVAYGAFVRAFGPINLLSTSRSTGPETGEVSETQRRPNLSPFQDDPDCWLVASIEDYDPESGTAKRGPVFTERVIHPPAEPVITSAADALAVTLAEIGRVDMTHVAELLGRSPDEVAAELGEAVFLDPTGTDTWLEGAWQTADAYLSGQVRRRLTTAEAAAAEDARYVRNVEALRRVQPEDLRPSDITARPGAPWIPVDVLTLFCAEVIGITTTIRHTVEIASWTVDPTPFLGQAAATSLWGTARRHAGLLLDDALNSRIPTIWDVWRDEAGEHRKINPEETEAAKEKLGRIKAGFEDWVWTDPDRADRLSRLYNDAYNNLVPRHFDGSHLTLPGASSAIGFRPHQKRGVWRIVSSGATYLAHAVGAGKTFLMAAAIMEQRRLGLVSKAMMVVPGHCLAQASREFLQLYPNARILVADETNFVSGKRQRFVARAATACWDCIIITHSAFKFIAAPAAFERGMVQAQVRTYSELLVKIDLDDRITRKRIEAMKEKLEAKLEALATPKDDMLTIAEMGVDQLIIDEAQEFRKLTFVTNMTNLKGVQPDGSQRAWDLYVKSRYVETVNPGRALVLASGTPITNTLAEMYTVQRYLQEDALEARGLHEFDAWAATFGESRTELELQPSGLYKPVTRFAEFVNVADLMAMFRSFADVVTKDDLRSYLRLPAIAIGRRQLITAEPSPAFRWYQRVLAQRIHEIEQRKGPPMKGDDILLSVITDGRHAAIDLRFVLEEYASEAGNKLSALIARVHAIWAETRERRYLRPDGSAYPILGAAQMVFSDLGTMNVEASRGFSAYRWIRDQLVARGVPASEIAFMQDHKKSAAKQRLFGDVNAGRVRVLIGSSETMGTGVNAQLRLVALHHLDVPWLPSQIEQREGRIERQGNQNEEIGIYAYATKGSTDATMWQANERKQRFINAAMSGDRSVRRIEDAGSQVSQFAMAKAIASGDPRLMQKAGLEAEIARLERQRAAHIDDQHAVRRALQHAEQQVAAAERAIPAIERDIAARTSTRGELFAMTVDRASYTERSKAGGALLNVLRNLDVRRAKPMGRLVEIAARRAQPAIRRFGMMATGQGVVARIGGFDVAATLVRRWGRETSVEVTLERAGGPAEVEFSDSVTALGLVSRLEHALDRFEVELAECRRGLVEQQSRITDYQPRVGLAFQLQGELEGKLAELGELEVSLAETSAAQPDDEPVRLLGSTLRLRRQAVEQDDDEASAEAA